MLFDIWLYFMMRQRKCTISSGINASVGCDKACWNCMFWRVLSLFKIYYFLSNCYFPRIYHRFQKKIKGTLSCQIPGSCTENRIMYLMPTAPVTVILVIVTSRTWTRTFATNQYYCSKVSILVRGCAFFSLFYPSGEYFACCTVRNRVFSTSTCCVPSSAVFAFFLYMYI
jgi:hypothetical protein